MFNWLGFCGIAYRARSASHRKRAKNYNWLFRSINGNAIHMFIICNTIYARIYSCFLLVPKKKRKEIRIFDTFHGYTEIARASASEFNGSALFWLIVVVNRISIDTLHSTLPSSTQYPSHNIHSTSDPINETHAFSERKSVLLHVQCIAGIAVFTLLTLTNIEDDILIALWINIFNKQ